MAFILHQHRMGSKRERGAGREDRRKQTQLFIARHSEHTGRSTGKAEPSWPRPFAKAHLFRFQPQPMIRFSLNSEEEEHSSQSYEVSSTHFSTSAAFPGRVRVYISKLCDHKVSCDTGKLNQILPRRTRVLNLKALPGDSRDHTDLKTPAERSRPSDVQGIPLCS